jgi:hypothetical protein
LGGTGISTSGAGDTVAISATPIVFTEGSVIFAGPGGLLDEDNASFFWDDTQKNLGIGTSTPSTDIHVRAEPISSAEVLVENTNLFPNPKRLNSDSLRFRIIQLDLDSKLWIVVLRTYE